MMKKTNWISLALLIFILPACNPGDPSGDDSNGILAVKDFSDRDFKTMEGFCGLYELTVERKMPDGKDTTFSGNYISFGDEHVAYMIRKMKRDWDSEKQIFDVHEGNFYGIGDNKWRGRDEYDEDDYQIKIPIEFKNGEIILASEEHKARGSLLRIKPVTFEVPDRAELEGKIFVVQDRNNPNPPNTVSTWTFQEKYVIMQTLKDGLTADSKKYKWEYTPGFLYVNMDDDYVVKKNKDGLIMETPKLMLALTEKR